MDLIRNCLDQADQKLASYGPRCTIMQFDKKLRCSVNGNNACLRKVTQAAAASGERLVERAFVWPIYVKLVPSGFPQ